MPAARPAKSRRSAAGRPISAPARTGRRRARRRLLCGRPLTGLLAAIWPRGRSRSARELDRRARFHGPERRLGEAPGAGSAAGGCSRGRSRRPPGARAPGRARPDRPRPRAGLSPASRCRPPRRLARTVAAARCSRPPLPRLLHLLATTSATTTSGCTARPSSRLSEARQPLGRRRRHAPVPGDAAGARRHPAAGHPSWSPASGRSLRRRLVRGRRAALGPVRPDARGGTRPRDQPGHERASGEPLDDAAPAARLRALTCCSCPRRRRAAGARARPRAPGRPSRRWLRAGWLVLSAGLAPACGGRTRTSPSASSGTGTRSRPASLWSGRLASASCTGLPATAPGPVQPAVAAARLRERSRRLLSMAITRSPALASSHRYIGRPRCHSCLPAPAPDRDTLIALAFALRRPRAGRRRAASRPCF